MTAAFDQVAMGLDAGAPVLLGSAGESDAIRVLLIMDGASDRGFLVNELSAQGFAVQAVASLAAAPVAVGDADVIVLHCDWAKVSSIELLDKLQRQTVGVPIVLLTSEASPAHKEVALDKPSIDVVGKSRGSDVLARRLKRAVEAFGRRSQLLVGGSMAEAGQVVAQAQPIYTLARDGPRDAVFNVHEWALTNVDAGKGVTISLVSDPAVTTLGDVRELSPAVNPSTQTVTVKIGLRETPAAMTLGALVNGTARLNQQKVVLVPWAALFEMEGRPAVWVLDPGGTIASLKPITIARYTKDQIAVSSGLQTGEIVVSAGVQMLHPGQKVEIANDRKPTGP